jgi:hypothetical protein
LSTTDITASTSSAADNARILLNFKTPYEAGALFIVPRRASPSMTPRRAGELVIVEHASLSPSTDLQPQHSAATEEPATATNITTRSSSMIRCTSAVLPTTRPVPAAILPN